MCIRDRCSVDEEYSVKILNMLSATMNLHERISLLYSKRSSSKKSTQPHNKSRGVKKSLLISKRNGGRTERSCDVTRAPSFKTFLDNCEISNLLKQRKCPLDFKYSKEIESSDEPVFTSDTFCLINCDEEKCNLGNLPQEMPETATFKSQREKYLNNTEIKLPSKSFTAFSAKSISNSQYTQTDCSPLHDSKQSKALSVGFTESISVKRITELKLTSNLFEISIMPKEKNLSGIELHKNELKSTNYIDSSRRLKEYVSAKENALCNENLVSKAINNIENEFKEMATGRNKRQNRKKYRYTFNNAKYEATPSLISKFSFKKHSISDSD
eukprot:TRINITY_DN4768_c0_g1_i1.p1 TRINITY_DN4768_c0_g1~~TRINITY_DN4768_c0_g1_i1.p1  ORF type:complete len:327 (+),score=15.64 TRINITY_DN4768_c0_g1_i1:73-1053(+)